MIQIKSKITMAIGVLHDEIDGKLYCEAMQGTNATKICKGNPHNCVKVKYHKEATKSDIRKINDRR